MRFLVPRNDKRCGYLKSKRFIASQQQVRRQSRKSLLSLVRKVLSAAKKTSLSLVKKELLQNQTRQEEYLACG